MHSFTRPSRAINIRIILVILLGPEAQPLPRGDAAHSPFISNQNVRASVRSFFHRVSSPSQPQHGRGVPCDVLEGGRRGQPRVGVERAPDASAAQSCNDCMPRSASRSQWTCTTACACGESEALGARQVCVLARGHQATRARFACARSAPCRKRRSTLRARLVRGW